jgi:hypothetical protein
VNFTSIRPVYIYGPLNYNPVEEYFFHRLKAGRPIVVPGSGMQVCGGGWGEGGEGGVCEEKREEGGRIGGGGVSPQAQGRAAHCRARRRHAGL